MKKSFLLVSVGFFILKIRKLSVEHYAEQLKYKKLKPLILQGL